ncbi:hypothetical protein EJ998_00115 [Burkholderia cepacia ATCC 25416]|nr:hypothetical protein EJ998_00115 [Burkholderia cepacia ATCC 25416]
MKEVVAGEAFYRRRHPNVSFEKVCVTNQFFNAQAKENAHLNSVELVDQKHLGESRRQLIRKCVSIRKFYASSLSVQLSESIYRSAAHSCMPAESSSRRAGGPPNPSGWLR